jgi:hypothetical protein
MIEHLGWMAFGGSTGIVIGFLLMPTWERRWARKAREKERRSR